MTKVQLLFFSDLSVWKVTFQLYSYVEGKFKTSIRH